MFRSKGGRPYKPAKPAASLPPSSNRAHTASRFLPEPVIDLSLGSRRIAVVLSSEFAAAHGRISAPAGYAVALFFDGDAFGAPMPVRIQFPDAQGRFSFEKLRPGRYRLAAVPPILEPGRPWFRNTANMTAFTLRPGQTTTLEVKLKQ